jgi:hypothetical protein
VSPFAAHSARPQVPVPRSQTALQHWPSFEHGRPSSVQPAAGALHTPAAHTLLQQLAATLHGLPSFVHVAVWMPHTPLMQTLLQQSEACEQGWLSSLQPLIGLAQWPPTQALLQHSALSLQVAPSVVHLPITPWLPPPLVVVVVVVVLVVLPPPVPVGPMSRGEPPHPMNQSNAANGARTNKRIGMPAILGNPLAREKRNGGSSEGYSSASRSG